ncbi:hypothetical protein K493DRAFT_320988 [Basidiobolus meristosporus CBS 931.73]|uniref:Uncharacterized protein n=1 Tax=Basidiobolus meristosporus CBS 931.73 TaxID=1314790 RepID=A0A1Y1X263_9FUNG|nr:hypothetical protein K493DRAFT_320988 [Basidiobolus meristosporus CBS 931.73]|eukprot:ORX79873.1 hypothetical protein K493DRAFT_320988 [Basidiobolus meristosporus CBS 931.73]
MKTFLGCMLALVSMEMSTSLATSSLCRGWSVSPLQHTADQSGAFVANEPVAVKWNALNSQIEYIQDIGLFSARSKEFLHTQYRSYPGINAAEGRLAFTLSVPLCLQREGEYYLSVYGSTPGNDDDCSLETLPFKLLPDPNADYSICDL